MKSQVHIAVTRRVKRGMEQAFMSALRDFARRSLHEPGVTGVHLIGPVPDSDGTEFGFLRSFENEESCVAFYESEVYARWRDEVAPLADGEPVCHTLNGLEAFFRGGGQPPPRWKMALVTWLGVFPTACVWSSLLSPSLRTLPSLLATAVVDLFIVGTLTWAIMPVLTKLLAPWLHGRPEIPPSAYARVRGGERVERQD